ncbi:MAG: phosphoglycerate kinase [Patescibacteria group bacterium]
MKTITDIEHIEGVIVLVRVDFNVPLKDGKVVEDYRIRTALPTIMWLRERGARIVLMSHLESVSGENESLEPVVPTLASLGVPVTFVKNIKNARVEIDKLQNGSCILLENLRFNDGEKINDPQFAKELASLGDMYINDAFSVSHREHASVVGVPTLIPGYAGLQLQKEIDYLSKSFTPRHPFLFILGGAKFDTKLPLLHRFIETADTLFVGGALANDIYKQKGYEIGTSLVSKKQIDLSAFIANPKVLTPLDIVTEGKEIRPATGVLPTDKILDAGPQTLELLRDKISTAEFILWNGPLGLYEDGYREPTHELARMIGEATARGAETIVGGGDTLAAIAELGIEDKFHFISTGGGAMLDFLGTGTLPGVEVLK